MFGLMERGRNLVATTVKSRLSFNSSAITCWWSP